MTSASDRPRLLLLKGHLLDPSPNCVEFQVSISGGRTTHFTDTATFQGCIQVNRAITNVGRANRHWVARQGGTRVACSHFVLSGIDDHDRTLL